MSHAECVMHLRSQSEVPKCLQWLQSDHKAKLVNRFLRFRSLISSDLSGIIVRSIDVKPFNSSLISNEVSISSISSLRNG